MNFARTREFVAGGFSRPRHGAGFAARGSSAGSAACYYPRPTAMGALACRGRRGLEARG